MKYVTEQRQPCPRCGESILPEAVICPHCRSEVLFDLWVTEQVTDGRVAYHSARDLETVADLPLDFLALKRSLEEAPGIVVPSVTRAVAAECEARLGALSIATRIAYHPFDDSDLRVRAPRTAATITGNIFRAAGKRPAATFALVLGLGLIAAVFMLDHGGGRPINPVEADAISTQEIAVLAERATVQLSCEQRLGAGFFVADDLIVTNAHVLCANNPQIAVTLSNGRTTAGRIVRTDAWLDLGLVRVSGITASPLVLADATHLERGDPVVMMGSPRGMDFTLSRGIVSHPNRAMMGISYLQIDAGINPGNSGGPLLDAGGRAVGVVSMMVGEANNLGFALPVNYLFAGPDALLAGHGVAYDAQRWSARIRAAADADRQVVAEARANVSRPGVVGAQIMQTGAVMALVVRWSDSRPREEHLRFALSRAGSEVCSPSGIASHWQRIGDGSDEQQESRYMMWLDRHGLTHSVYASPVQLGMTGCPDPTTFMGATLTLRNGAQHANQVVVGSDGVGWGR
jgi:S1-C subfamily serine protease